MNRAGRIQLSEISGALQRHSFASKLSMACVELRTVAEWLGHRTLL